MISFILTLLKYFFFQKQFDFTAGHSTGHALLELIDQICECFDEKKYFIGILLTYEKDVIL